MFINSKAISNKQKEQLKPLIDRGVHLEELIIDDVNQPEGMHYIFAHHIGKTQHFYITDNANERESKFVCDSIWESIE
ncbi:hypothetical protein Q4512_06670 [Oceanihabitans sp. 2_MG-2023]|uniref:hypothetical protein n=1 Tax=Oceanihabitans sp. 2_MG-2023 TaxID=3062661 RepID=UPI0026E48C4F|nr:hypothetical protein [Oceanihabitans sp. 2_MG-2023]MDO6596591.1 hypothetical protein [Oceanihabitans sp. 2_MG-2023]